MAIEFCSGDSGGFVEINFLTTRVYTTVDSDFVFTLPYRTPSSLRYVSDHAHSARSNVNIPKKKILI